MHLIFQILCFSLLFFKGNSELIFRCLGMLSGDTAAVKEGGQIHCDCSDNEYPNDPLSFKIDLVHDVIGPQLTVNGIYNSSPDNRTIYYQKKDIVFGDAGLYTCINEAQNVTASIYIWVKTEKRSFMIRHRLPRGVTHRSHIKVPCVPTSPCFDVSLIEGTLLNYKEIKVNETNGITYDPREGFTITNPSYIRVPILLTCKHEKYPGSNRGVSYQFEKFADE